MANSEKSRSLVDVNDLLFSDYESLADVCGRDSSDDEMDDTPELPQQTQIVATDVVETLQQEVREALCSFTDDDEDSGDDGDAEDDDDDGPRSPMPHTDPPPPQRPPVQRNPAQRPRFAVVDQPPPDEPARTGVQLKVAARCKCAAGLCLELLDKGDGKLEDLRAIHRSMTKTELDLVILGKLSVLIAMGEQTIGNRQLKRERKQSRCRFMVNGKSCHSVTIATPLRLLHAGV